VFQWIVEHRGIPLAAAVDTGDQLEGWFAYPEDAVLKELKAILPGLDCEESSFTPSYPVALPGCIHPKTGVISLLTYMGATRPALQASI
jgi:hypothetical protein